MLFLVTFIDATIHNGYFLMTGGFLGKIGIQPENIMLVMSIGQVAEILTMAILGWVLARLGWRTTMIVGILGHAARFAVSPSFPTSPEAIVAVQVLHGICYAFFFATVYIFIDVAFPKDVRSSAQGLFNLLILGPGRSRGQVDLRAAAGRADRRWADRLPLVVPGPHGDVAGRRALAGLLLPPAARPADPRRRAAPKARRRRQPATAS